MSDWLFFPDDNEPVPAAVEDWAFSATPVETWSVTQATGGYGRGPDGRWVAFPPNTPRTYFDPITLEDRGVLLEPESYQTVFKPRLGPLSLTNIIRADLSNEPCPFGIGVANLAATAINGFHSFNLISGPTVAEAIQDGVDVTGQWIIKPNGINRFTMFCQKRDATYASVNFDMRGNGEVTAPVGCTATIERDALGYYRMSMSLNGGTGTTALRFGGQMALDDGVRGFLGDGVQGFHLAYFGIERGLFMSSPSTANGTLATIRAADVMVSSVPWIGTGPKSFGIEFTPLTNHDQTILHAGTADTIQIRIEGGTIRYAASTNGESVAFLSGPTLSPGVSRTVVVTAGFNQFLLGHSGTILGADLVGSAPSAITTMRIGGNITGENFRPMAVKRLKFWNQALTESATIQYSKDINIPGVNISETEITVQPAITVSPDQNTVSFVVSLSQKDLAAKVNYRTVSDTAIAGIDFLETTGTLDFLFGELNRTITVQLGVRAEVNRHFKFELNFPQSATIDNAVCQVTLLGQVRTLPTTSLDVVFGQTVSGEWSLTRPTPAPRRKQDGIWELVAINAPAHHWVFADYFSGILLDTAGHDQCLFDSALPETFSGMTYIIDIVTQTMVGTRSVVVTETADTSDHRVRQTITAGLAASGGNPAIPATGEVPTGDFTVWFIVQPGARKRWIFEAKGRDNVWHIFRFNLTGTGTVEEGPVPGGWADIQRDEFFPDCYRIAVGKGQGSYAGVDPEFSLAAADDEWNTTFTGTGDTANSLRIMHMQVESRIGWGAPLVTAAATAKVIRAPDDLRATGEWFKGRNSWSFGLIFARLSNQPAIQRILHVRDAVPMKDDYGFYLNNASTAAPNTTGAIFNGTIPGLPTLVNGMHTVVLSVDPARFALFHNGLKTGEQLLLGKVPPNPVAAMRLGARLDGTNLQTCALFLRIARYWTGSMTDAEGVHYSDVLTALPLPPPPVPSVVSVPTNLRIREGSILTVPITRTGGMGTCFVTYTTKAGTAKFGADYNGVGPVVMEFGPNETVKTFTVQTIADTVDDHEDTFTVELSNFVECTPGNTICEVKITDYPKVHLPLTASINEGGVLTVNITKTGEGACSVAWETKQSKAGMVGIDYVGVGSPPVVVNFGETETQKAISVTTLQDTIPDPNEVFTIVLSGETNCGVGNRTCTVTITDDEMATSGIYARSTTFASPLAGGGIGKPVYRVTSLADTNTAGTLRYGIGLGGRHIIFEVGGVIKLSGDLSFTEEDVYISGETAPYPGITLRGTSDKGGTIKTGASKRVTFSHINFERCHDGRVTEDTNVDVVMVTPGSLQTSEDIEFRHCAFWWSMDEIVSVWATGEDAKRGTCQRISFTDCLFAEPLYRPDLDGYQGHYKRIGGVPKLTTYPHNYGNIFGARSYNCDIQYSMYTDCDMRTPFIDGDTSIVLANNIQLNCNTGSHVSVNDYDQPTKKYVVTCIGQLAISGPDTTSSIYSAMRIHSNVVTTHPAGSIVWADGLYSIKGPGSKITPGTTVTVAKDPPQKSYIADITKVARPLDIPNAPIVKLTADEIRQRAIDNIGPFPKNRIPHMIRKIQQLKDNTGARINHQNDVGGPTDTGTTKYERKLDGTTKFPDNTPIPAYPTLGTNQETNWKNVRAWLELFLKQIQYD
jgi:hypothetical protein